MGSSKTFFNRLRCSPKFAKDMGIERARALRNPGSPLAPHWLPIPSPAAPDSEDGATLHLWMLAYRAQAPDASARWTGRKVS